MDRLLKLLMLACTLALTISGTRAQYSWQKSNENPVVPEWSGLVNDPSGFKYAFEPTVLYDSSSQVFRMWFASLAEGYGTSFVISRAISLDGQEWYAGVKNPVFAGTENAFDAGARSPRVIHDSKGYKMYYTGQNGDAYAIGLAVSSDGKSWQRYSNSPILQPDTVSKWDPSGQAFCDVYYDDSTYYMWFLAGTSTLNGIGLAKSTDGIHWAEVTGNPVFAPSGSGWDGATVADPAIVRVGKTFYMFYGGSGTPGTVNFSIGLATSQDGIKWVRYGANPILTIGSGWEGVSLGGLAVCYLNGTFHMWYSGLSSLSGHWQIGYATSTYAPLGVGAVERTPEAYVLLQNYPNPFNPSTTVRYALPSRAHVTLTVFTALGQNVGNLVNETQEAGYHDVRFDGSGLASGMYYYRLRAGEFVQSRKLLLLR